MADALVSAVLKTVVGMLGSAALQEVSLVWGLKDEIDKLESVFGAIQAVLHDAELKQRKSEPIQNWLRKLKDAACDAENILDRIATEGLRRRANSERGSPLAIRCGILNILPYCEPSQDLHAPGGLGREAVLARKERGIE
ncbi:hypothetical protein ACS0TY_008614 [Phlomoides rotata]